MLTLAAVLDHLERLTPSRLAADWDNVGLLLGDRAAPVTRIMTCLTVTPDSATEAVDRQANLIVTHHPIFFKPVRRLTTDTSDGRMLLGLARAGVAVYSPHTAFDNAVGGINELLASKLGLIDVGPLRRGQGPKQVKLVVFVPERDLTRVSDAVFAAGAGRIGEYRECSFRLAGTGTFFGSEASNPTVGQKGRREEAPEWRLEVVCPPEAKVADIVAAMRKAHSYEEPAFDLYPLDAAPTTTGEGRLGTLPSSMTLEAVARTLKQTLGGTVQAVGQMSREMRRVAIVCGVGGELLPDAIRARADVFVTGELRFHDYLAAQAQGIGLVLPGHYATERCGVEELAWRLKALWPDLEVWASTRETDPVTWV